MFQACLISVEDIVDVNNRLGLLSRVMSENMLFQFTSEGLQSIFLPETSAAFVSLLKR